MLPRLAPITATAYRAYVFAPVASRKLSIMPTSNPEVPNASGYPASKTKEWPERSVEPHEKDIIDAIKELYTCKPRESTYNVYADNAVFHDPVGIANGKESVIAQFNALAKIFDRAEIPRFRVLQAPKPAPANKIFIDQDVAYFRSGNASSPTKTVNSLLTLETDASHKIVRHTEEWDHMHEPNQDEDGIWGWIQEARKSFTATITDKLTSKQPPSKP